MCDTTADFQFWMNWGVQAAVSLFTLAAVLVALFGQNLFVRWWPPILRLSIPNPYGEATPVVLRTWQDKRGAERQRSGPDRYYHLVVENARRWSHANQVQVCLVKIEVPAIDGRYVPTWTGDIPLAWENQSVYPTLRSMGPPARIDLCSVQGKCLSLHPLITAANLPWRWDGPVWLKLFVQAKSTEADSEVLAIMINWNGKFHEGTEEMSQHLALRVADKWGDLRWYDESQMSLFFDSPDHTPSPPQQAGPR
jgi:hypothetical protein